MFDKIQKAFAEALVEASDNFQAKEQVQAEIGSAMGTLHSDRSVTSWNIAWDSDNHSSLKSQMIEHQDEINAMSPVTDVVFDKSKGKTYAAILNDILRTKFGYRIERQDGASFLFDETAIGTLRHYVTSDEEAAAVIAAPYVLKRGKAISGHKNHKENGYPSVTYAAPVTINGDRVNVGVAVLFADKDRPHSLRVLMPSGKEYVMQKIKTDPGMEEASPKSDVPSPTGSVSKNSIRNNSGFVNSESAEAMDVEMDAKTESVAPAVMKSERTWTETDKVSHKGQKLSDRNPKWKPKLDNTEWGIVNYIVKHNQGTAITSTCNLFLKKSKGKTVFGIYSIEDSTLLYASSKQTAEKEHAFVGFLREEYRNGNVTDTSAEGLRTWAKTVRMQRTTNDNYGSGNVAPGRSAGNAELHGRSPGLYASPALRNVLQNIFQKEAAGRTGYGSIKKSERGEDTSNRALLANAFEGLSKSSVEYQMIQDYREQIKVLNLLDEQLSKLNAEIREIRFTKGKYDAEKLHALEEKAERIAKDINKQDKVLIRMEASETLRKIIAFERKKAAQKTKEHIAEIQQNKKLRAEQAELRHKIRRTVRDLDKLLNRGNKKRNVKEDMQGFVSKALELADYLFTGHISDDDLFMFSPPKTAYVRKTVSSLKTADG